MTAAGIGYSVPWMELKAVHGGGIPYRKIGRRTLYKKRDALAWLEANSQRVKSTSEYRGA
ncbi:MAG: DNA-binding protein [Magnetococcales bacterium]|nr:DNA-binding protein [Magnetococcales bacterium]